jgi:hypothetical protein
VRRYMGNTWLSVREAGSLLGWSDEAVLAAVSSCQVAAVWRRGRVGSWGHPREMVPYLSGRQVEDLAFRLHALEAAFSKWEDCDG